MRLLFFPKRGRSRQGRAIERAARYLEDPRLILSEREDAISDLIQALYETEGALRRKIVLLLAGLAGHELSEALIAIMTNRKEPEQERDQAAFHLSVVAPLCQDATDGPSLLNSRLLPLLESTDPDERLRAMTALAWEGNNGVVPQVARLLDDPDQEVRDHAVGALWTLGGIEAGRRLLRHLETASGLQRRLILSNLWRFSGETSLVRQAVSECRSAVSEGDHGEREAAIECLCRMARSLGDMGLFGELLSHPSEDVRVMTLERIGQVMAGVPDLPHVDRLDLPLRPLVTSLLEDPSMRVKRAALLLLRLLDEQAS